MPTPTEMAAVIVQAEHNLAHPAAALDARVIDLVRRYRPADLSVMHARAIETLISIPPVPSPSPFHVVPRALHPQDATTVAANLNTPARYKLLLRLTEEEGDVVRNLLELMLDRTTGDNETAQLMQNIVDNIMIEKAIVASCRYTDRVNDNPAGAPR